MDRLSEEEWVFKSFNERRLSPDSNSTTALSTILAAILGIIFLSRALSFCGYPVSFWWYMAQQRLRSLPGGSTVGLPLANDVTQATEMQRGGNMLTSVFGLNGSSLLQKGVRGVTGALSKGSSGIPPGLGNWDNSCYQNSVIQGLASLPSLHDYLFKTTAEFPSLQAETTNGALLDMITKLNNPDNNGQNFWIRGKLKSMSTIQQQDAQEYYSKILDALEKEVQVVAKERRTSSASLVEATKCLNDFSEIVTSNNAEASTLRTNDDSLGAPEQVQLTPNPLDGLLAQRVGCIRCGYSEGLQLIPFNCLTVSLGKSWAYDIQDCLDEYTNLELIEGVECAKCTLLHSKAALSRLASSAPQYEERLRAVQDALDEDDFDDKTLVKKFRILKKNWRQSTKSRQAVVARAPKSLVLHLNRSIFDEATGDMYKNSANVTYPSVLDLRNWCLGSDAVGEAWPRDPTTSMLAANPKHVTPSPFQYRLRAVVTHTGTHGNGHYVCYRPHTRMLDLSAETDQIQKDTNSEQWWRLSDDSVYAISEEQAHQGNVFMLFYERIDKPQTNPPEPASPVPQIITSTEAIPLPPAEVITMPIDPLHRTAIDIALPEDDEFHSDSSCSSVVSDQPAATADFSVNNRPITSPPVKRVKLDTLAYPTPPPSTTTQDDNDMSEVDSEDAPSTHITSDDETDAMSTTLSIKFTASPHTMRTAGDTTNKGNDSTRSLPMISAT